jgi:predicted nucleic acid-binding Zn ribbon protein
VLERRQGFEDPRLTECEECSGELRRVLQPVQVIFKGPGFYSTDYRTKSPTEAEAPKTTSANGDDKSSTSTDKKTESTATKTETAAAPSSSNRSGNTNQGKSD